MNAEGSETTDHFPAKLLWTAGWDSTYRLLELILVRERTVQPYYVGIERTSAAMELQAMNRIRARLFSAWPETRARLLDTIFIDKSDVPHDPSLWEALRSLREMSSSRRLGGQYYDLAIAAESLDLKDLELGVHTEEGSLWFDQLVANVDEGADGAWRLASIPSLPQLEIFRRFAFPLLHLDKRQMEERARSAGFDDLLELTWFCHTPDRKGRPCGLCAPCRITMQQGLDRRIPKVNRLRHHLLWPIVKLLGRYRVRHRAKLAWEGLRSAIHDDRR